MYKAKFILLYNIEIQLNYISQRDYDVRTHTRNFVRFNPPSNCAFHIYFYTFAPIAFYIIHSYIHSLNKVKHLPSIHSLQKKYYTSFLYIHSTYSFDIITTHVHGLERTFFLYILFLLP